MNKSIKESSKSGGIPWLLQRISAIYLFIALVSHFVFYHFIRHGDINKADILKYATNPIFKVLQFLFLVSALYHGLNGLWMVIEDYIHNKYLRIVLYSLLIVVGTALFFVGTLTIIKLSGRS